MVLDCGCTMNEYRQWFLCAEHAAKAEEQRQADAWAWAQREQAARDYGMGE